MRVQWLVEDAARPGGVESVVQTLNASLNADGVSSHIHSWLPARGRASTPGTGWLVGKVRAAWNRELAARAAARAIRRDVRSDPGLVVVLDPGSLSVARRLVGLPRWGVHLHWSPNLLLEPWEYLAGDNVPPGLKGMVRWRMRGLGRRNRHLLSVAPFVVTLTRSHSDEIRSLNPNVIEIGNPIATTLRRRPRHSSGTDVVLGYVGRLSYEKGPDVLVRALAELPPNGVRTLIAGSGPLEAETRRLVDELEVARVEFLGWVDDPSAVLDRVDVLVLPSRSEAVPLVLAEALAAGCVVVAADAGGGVRDVLRSGLLGSVVSAEDPHALAAAIARAADDVRAGRLPDEAAVRELLKAHDPTHVTKRWRELAADCTHTLPR